MKRRKRIKKWLLVLMACIIVYTPVMNVSAAKKYSNANMFHEIPIKGMQGAERSSLYGGLNHTLCNVYLDDAIKAPDSAWAANGWIAPYVFEGETFYFAEPAGMGFVDLGNRKNMSVSIVFLLRKTVDEYGADSSFLIDAESNRSGYLYYAPNTDLSTYGGRAMRAYWHYLMEWLLDEGLHLDNFILGNEVNMPNQWHYSGGVGAQSTATKYADAFYQMWSAVREHTNVSRCSVSVDHSWQNDDEGRGISVKSFLHMFNDRLEQLQSGVDWCVSTHLYPALLYDTEIWNDRHNLAPNNSSARIVDGSNLSVMTNYIRDTWGENHRVMLTEQGFSDECGSAAQAACLAYTYYAAMYDPMVDAFLINTANAGIASTGEGLKSLNFTIEGTLAGEVYTKIGNGNAADQQWIADTCLPVIGVSSWSEIVPNYGQNVNKNTYVAPLEIDPEKRALIEDFVKRMYREALGREAEEAGLESWTNDLGFGRKTGTTMAYGFIFSQEFQNFNYCNSDYVKQLYRAFMGREYDDGGLSYWVNNLQSGMTREEVFNGFSHSAEFDNLCKVYGIKLGDTISIPQYGTVPNGACTACGKEDGITAFVTRLYNICFARTPDEGGLNDWTTKLREHTKSGKEVAFGFIFSEEFTNKGLNDEDYVEYLYNAFFDRSSDTDGKNDWLSRMHTQGYTREDVFNGFVGSAEFDNLCKQYGITRE